MQDEKDDDSPNPPFQRPHPPEHPAAAKWRLYSWHKRQGTLEFWYDLYPEDRPKRRERGSGGRDAD